MERILYEHIRNLFSPEMISQSQHAYMKGRSVDTALHNSVRIIESSLEHNQYTLASFLDIEGAFKNITLDAIVNSLIRIRVDNSVCQWISLMLRSREINSKVGESSLTRYVTRGTPQGGVLSPLLWLLVVNTILLEIGSIGIKAVAYADDVVLLVLGLFLNILSERMQLGLCTLFKWAVSCGLRIHPLKTELVLFRRGYTTPTFRLPSLNCLVLGLSTKANFLGVILVQRLTWRENLEERVKKAQVAFSVCQKAIGKT